MKSLYTKYLLVVFVFLSYSLSTEAQLTTSAFSGHISGPSGAVAEALVSAQYLPTGVVYRTFSDDKGYYHLSGIMPGGPYVIRVDCQEAATAIRRNLTAPLAQVAMVDFELNVKELNTVVITSDTSGSPMDIARCGINTMIADSTIVRFPSTTGKLSDVLRLVPQIQVSANGFSLAGGNYRGSAVTVDGAPFNNAFGIGSSLPAGGNPISLEALGQISVNIAPFDVRQSGFSGGVLNISTPSGSNDVHGTVYDYVSGSGLTGDQVGENRLTSSRWLYNRIGATFRAPLVRDRLFLFLNTEYCTDKVAGNAFSPRSLTTEDFGGSTGRVRPTTDQMETIKDFLAEQFDYTPGRYTDYSLHTPDYKVLARLDWIINQKNTFFLRFSRAHTSTYYFASNSMSPLGGTNTNFVASDNNTYTVNRYDQGRTSNYALPFESSNYCQEEDFTSVTAELNSHFAKGNNIARITWSSQYEPRSFIGGDFPTVDILEPYMDRNNNKQYAFLTTFGPDPFTYNNLRHVRTLILTDEYTITLGRHSLTAGLQYEWNQIVNGFMQGGTGWYIYESWQSFVDDVTSQSSMPVAFMITHANSDNPTENSSAKIHYATPSVYLQDEMELSRYFKLTVGLRVELPMLQIPLDNKNVDFARIANGNANSSLGGLSTDDVPQVRPLLSPRIGFNWDVFKDRTFILRGGTGLFTGRIPNVWLVSVVGNSNCLQYQYIANMNTGSSVVHFAPNVEDVLNNLYSSNAFHQQALPAPTSPTILDRDLRMPTSWKSSIDADVQLPFGIRANFDGLFSYDLNEVSVTMLGYKESGEIQLPGEPNARPIYTSENLTNASGSRVSGYLLRNVTDLHGYHLALTAQLSRSFPFGLEVMGAYTYNLSRTVSDGVGDQVYNLAYTYNVGDVKRPEVGYSSFASPHRLIVSLGYAFRTKKTTTRIALFYDGSHIGYVNQFYAARASYVMKNVSGLGASQLVYIPTDEELQTMPFVSDDNRREYGEFIAEDSYLASHRGEYAERGGVVAPWMGRFNIALTHEFRIMYHGEQHRIEVGVNLDNVANLLNRQWGCYKQLSSETILAYNSTANQYTFTCPQWNNYVNQISTWQLRLHLKYSF